MASDKPNPLFHTATKEISTYVGRFKYRAQKSSTTVPNKTPATSETIFPIAAAHMVEIPNVTPRDVSIMSPAKIMLSTTTKRLQNEYF